MRYGPGFEKTLTALLQSEKWRKADIDAYIDERIAELVAYAFENVPYYRETMRRRRLVPGDIRSRADLQKLPILTKEQVRHNLDKLCSEKTDKRRLLLRHTSGTTGKSLHFYVSRAAIAFQWAVWWRHRHRFGLHRGMSHVNWTGKMAVPPKQCGPPYWRWNWPMNQAVVNMHHLTPAKIPYIMRFLNEHGFEFYSGYPSIVHALCLASQEQGLALSSRPRVVVTGAENIYDFQRRDIIEFTGATITDQYGFSEGGGNASQCKENAYHEDFEFGILERVDAENLGNGMVRGRIVSTGFANPEFPLIRYDVGDIGVWANADDPCPCGRESRTLTAIEGRTDDYVVTPEGRRIMRFDYIFKDTVNVRECQIVQRRPDTIVVRIVKRPAFNGKDEAFITSEIGRWISPRLGVEYEYVSEIERERNGKFRAVKSEIHPSLAVSPGAAPPCGSGRLTDPR
jgi:phenylacetate-CoA ligase